MNETPTRAPVSWPAWRVALTGLSALGLGLSAYLGWHSITGTAAIGCGAGSSCDDVLHSPWSSIGGVLPVSGLAASVYLALLAASFFTGSETEPAVRRIAWRAMLIFVGAAAGSAVWFIAVQKWMIGAFCPYCMATHVTGLVLAALVIARARQENEVTADFSTVGAGPKDSRLAAREKTSVTITPAATPVALFPSGRALTAWPSLGLFFAAMLAVSQIVITPPSLSRGGEGAPMNGPALDLRSVPLVGSPDASHVVALLFDYNCPHCQQLHAKLDEAIARYHGKLAFALCPSPLNTACNPFITGDADAFKDSCELARLGLTVWVANRAAFAEFDRWMFTAEPGRLWHPRKPDAARAKAIELIGQAKLEAAQRDPWIERYLQSSVALYGANGAGAVPKLVSGSRWVTPQPRDTEDFLQILQNTLGLPKP